MKIENIDDINTLISRMEDLQKQAYVFRGQADTAWKLIPAVFRRIFIKNVQNENFQLLHLDF